MLFHGQYSLLMHHNFMREAMLEGLDLFHEEFHNNEDLMIGERQCLALKRMEKPGGEGRFQGPNTRRRAWQLP